MDSITELRKRRIALGLSLGELARAVGRSDATLSRIERGQIRPSYELVQRIVRQLEERESIAAPHLRAEDVMNPTIVTVDAGAALSDAALVMERHGFSQAPVLEEGRVTGSISENSVLRALQRPEGRKIRVRDAQEGTYPQVDAQFPADLLTVLLSRYPAVLVVKRGALCGIVTRADLIRSLRGATLRRAPAP